MSALKTIVHVESRNRFCSARNISATPASPAWVAMRICSTYLALGGASCFHEVNEIDSRVVNDGLLAFILVPPLTDFSNEPDMVEVVVSKLYGEADGKPQKVLQARSTFSGKIKLKSRYQVTGAELMLSG